MPESETFWITPSPHGESAGSQTAQLLKLLDLYGAAALRRAICEALEAGYAARLLGRFPVAATAALRSAARRSISAVIPKHSPSMFGPTIWRPTMNSPAHDDDDPSIACRATRADRPARRARRAGRLSGARHQIALVSAACSGTSGAGRSRRTLPPQPGTAAAVSGIKKLQTHGRLRLVLAQQDRTRRHRTRADPGLPPRGSQPGSGGHATAWARP